MTAIVPLAPTERLALSLIEAAANAGEVCPSNAVIAQRIGAGLAKASDVVLRLEKKGWIRVERFMAGRAVTIVTSGRATRWDHARTPHVRRAVTIGAAVRVPVRDRSPARSAGPVRPAATFTRLDRDPCFLCGTRADLGCAHRSAAVPEEVSA